MADKNHDGRISFQELKEVMEKSQCSCSEAELQDYVNDEIQMKMENQTWRLFWI